jgi:hypothetical protein
LGIGNGERKTNNELDEIEKGRIRNRQEGGRNKVRFLACFPY